MGRYFFLLLALVGAMADTPQPELGRVDAQVLNGLGLTIAGLQARDFVLQVDGKVQPIKNFEGDGTPIDVLLLVDVSAQMKPHVKQLADVAEQAMHGLTEQDRVGIMVFDVNVRPHLPLTSNRGEVPEDLKRILSLEHFAGGARVTSSLIFAASYLQRHARPEARRAIVILTGNATQDGEDQERVEKALQRADAALSFLFAGQKAAAIDEDGDPIPTDSKGKGKHRDEAPQVKHGPPLSPIHSASTETIARDSGGDAVEFTDEDALEDMFLRLRQRYVLRFDAPEDKQEKTFHEMTVDLSREARGRVQAAAVHYRLLFVAGEGMEEIMAPIDAAAGATPQAQHTSVKRRRAAVNEDSSRPPDPRK